MNIDWFGRLRAVAYKESLHVIRDPRSLLLGILMPVIMLFLFGYALTLDIDRIPLAVWDQSATPMSRELLSRFTGSRYFVLKVVAKNYHDIEQAIDRRTAMAGMVIPATFAPDGSDSHPVSIQLILDGSDPNTATIVQGYAEGIVSDWSGRLEQGWIARSQGERPLSPRFELRPRIWFNADMVSRNFIFPGLIPVIMMIVAALLTALSMAREWETGTMEPLITMPVARWELVVGKLVPYAVIGVFDLMLSIGIGYSVFGVPLRGSLILLIALSLLFLLGALSLGMLISIIARSQLLASQIALMVTVLPAFLLSGFVFPIENMPLPIQTVSRIVVARYYVTILRGIYLKDVGLSVLWPEALFLAAFAAIILTIAITRYKKSLEP